MYAAMCFPAALAIQVGTNLINDAEDFRRGADTEKRVGPTRVTQAGLLSMAQVHGAGVLCFLLGCLLCVPAFVARGWRLLLLVLTCCCAGYAYTGGPYPLAYHGLGDLTVVVFFGAVATAGLKVTVGGGRDPLADASYRYYDADTLVAGTQIGLLCCMLLAINNIRDYHSDREHNKRTLVVRFGLRFGRWEVAALVAAAYALGFCHWYLVRDRPLAFALPVACSSPIALGVVRDVLANTGGGAGGAAGGGGAEAKKDAFGAILARSALLHLVFSAALAASIAFSC